MRKVERVDLDRCAGRWYEIAHRYLWVLARESVLEEATYRGILERIEAQGYDPNNLVRTNQDSQ